jgi:GxxExxY protein
MSNGAKGTTEPLIEADVTKTVVGAFFDCYNQLGVGFLETVYEGGLGIILQDEGFEVRRQEKITVWFREREIGHFRADIIVNNRVLVEIKRARRIHSRHKAQLLNALKATNKLGLLLNFGPKPQFKRVILTNDKNPTSPRRKPDHNLYQSVPFRCSSVLKR